MRLIDADAYLKKLRADPLYYLVERYGVDGTIEAMPTIDAVQVVRCKDCKHFDGSYPMCCRFEETFEPDGYCSFGEKREVEG